MFLYIEPLFFNELCSLLYSHCVVSQHTYTNYASCHVQDKRRYKIGPRPILKVFCFLWISDEISYLRLSNAFDLYVMMSEIKGVKGVERCHIQMIALNIVSPFCMRSFLLQVSSLTRSIDLL